MRDTADQLKPRPLILGDKVEHPRAKATIQHDEVSSPQIGYSSRTLRSISTWISPPPLKRRRIQSGNFNPVTSGPSSLSLTPHCHTGPRAVQSSPNSFDEFKVRPVDEPRRLKRASESRIHSSSVLVPSAYEQFRNRNPTAMPRHRHDVQTDRSTRPPIKGRCCVCERSTAANYNPIILCPTCERPYHDSCRKPPLKEDTDPQSWICSICLSSSRGRISAASARPRASRLSLDLPSINGLADKGSSVATQKQRVSLAKPHIREYLDPARGTSVLKNTASRHSSGCPELKSSSGTASRNGCHGANQSRRNAKTANCNTRHSPDPINRVTPPETLDRASSGNPSIASHLLDGKLGLIEQLENNTVGRNKVPSTPTQHSCQAQTPPKFTSKHQFQHDETDTVNDSSVVSSRNEYGKKTPLTVICSTCQKQRVLPKSGKNSIACSNCQDQSSIVEMSGLEIPETPHNAFSHEANARTTPPIAQVAAIASSPTSTVKPVSAPLSFESNLVASNPKTVQKKVGDHENETACTSIESREPHPTSDNADHVSQVTDASRQVFVHKAMKTKEPTPSNEHISTEPSCNRIVKSTLYQCQPELDIPHRESDYNQVRTAELEMVKEVIGSVSSQDHRDHVDTFTTTAAGGKPLGSTQTKPILSPTRATTTESSFGSTAVTRVILKHPTPRAGDKRYTITKNHILGPAPHKRISKRPRPIRAIKSAPTPASEIVSRSRPDPRVINYTKCVSSKLAKHDDLLFTPFERRTPRQPRDALSFNHNITRETSFYKVVLHSQRSGIETMTQASKANKIAEIKARPRRKTFFGSDHRLAHVRRDRRHDIHDERDGAWKPNGVRESEKVPKPNRGAGIHDRTEFRCLREVFNLPENVIPMNDGQSELAFRDGTVINGRLPRPRQIYKVGKLLGGELTIRTS